MSNRSEKLVKDMFQKADIRINGFRPFDIQVLNNSFYRRIVRHGQLGLGESYMDGWWECDAIDQMTEKFIRAGLLNETAKNIRYILNYISVFFSDIGKISDAYEVGRTHYDLGNELFGKMLDKRMIYSCAYWKDTDSLEEAQEQKLDLICRKLNLTPGMKVLDIGCGWGGWAKFAAKHYGVEVTGITVSREQAKFAREYCKEYPVEIRLEDYRNLNKKYDRVVSIAMFEAVGRKYFRVFMEVVEKCLKDDGIFLLHTIVGRIPLGPAQSPWLNKYIFPNGELPTLADLSQSAQDLFVEEDHHHFVGHYEKTLEAWYNNFLNHWDTLSKNYDERFYRMWTFYLLLSKGIFQSRIIHLWQFLYTKDGIPNIKPKALQKNPNIIDIR